MLFLGANYIMALTLSVTPLYEAMITVISPGRTDVKVAAAGCLAAPGKARDREGCTKRQPAR